MFPDFETLFLFQLEKANRQIEYANRIRNDHKKREFPKRASSHVTCPPLPSKATIVSLRVPFKTNIVSVCVPFQN